MGAAPHATLQPFVLPPTRVQELLQERQCTLLELMQQLVPSASAMARPCTSKFHVGCASATTQPPNRVHLVHHSAVGLGASGAIYLGCNVELPCLPLSASIHAEQFLITNIRHRGEAAITHMAVSAAPCGHCRQFLAELGSDHDLRIAYGTPPAPYSLDELLLHRFGPEDLLGCNPPPLMLEPQHNAIQLAEEAQEWALAHPSMADALQTCLHHAVHAYSPYTRSPSAVVLVTQQGVFGGGYVESAAYNPSLPPLQAAVVEAVMGGVGDLTEVTAAILLELPGAPVQQAAVTRASLQAIAPAAALTVLPLAATRGTT